VRREGMGSENPLIFCALCLSVLSFSIVFRTVYNFDFLFFSANANAADGLGVISGKGLSNNRPWTLAEDFALCQRVAIRCRCSSSFFSFL